MSIEVKPCPVCGDGVTPHKLYIWHVSCADCYDGAPDAGPQLHGFAETEAAAIAVWNERVEEFEAERDEHCCKWCGSYTENRSRKCDECLRDIEIDRRIDEARGR